MSDNPRVAIPYFSGRGHTRRLAEVIADGAGHAELFDVTELQAADWAVLDGAQAIVFASSTYMGG